MSEGGPKPTKAFYVAIGVVVLGLGFFGLYRAGVLAPKGKEDKEKTANVSKEALAKDVCAKAKAGDTCAIPGAQAMGVCTAEGKDLVCKAAPSAEGADPNVPTTVKEYSFVPEQKLPAVSGVSAYKKLDGAVPTVTMALNVWAGWAPIVYANGGHNPKKEWTTASGKKFKVQYKLIDDPVAMRGAYAAGDIHIGWATVDMLPLFIESLAKDSRTMPRVYQQVDWSNGGDGIVVRDSIKSISDLRGKTIVLAQNSPSQFFIMNALINGGVQPSEVNFKYTGDAFQAAAAFNGDKSIAACVSWAPDIYNLAKAKGNKLLVSTLEANRLIADVWFARADFAKDNPEIIEALVRGFLDAAEELQADATKKQEVAKLLAAFYNLPEADAMGMLGDAHWTNYAENRDFFLNENNPTNFQRTWDTAFFIYGRLGKTGPKIEWDQVADFSVLQKLGKEEKYAKSQNTYVTQFAPKSVGSIQAESPEILTKTIVIHFAPNNSDIRHQIERQIGDKTVREPYDPNVDFVLEDVGRLAGQFGACRIVIEGHSDASMKGSLPDDSMVKQLSQQRADSVRGELLKKFSTLKADQFSAVGKGWDVPADAKEPMNHAKNRRVEIKVYPLEAK